MVYNVDILYSSQIKEKTRRNLINKIKRAKQIVIVVRQVPKGNVLPRFIGGKGKTGRGFCCYIYKNNTTVEIMRALIETKLSNIHWIEFHS